MVWSWPSRYSTAKQQVIACWLSGWADGCRVRLAGPVPALGADDELDAGHRQQVAQLGRVEEIGGDQRSLLSGPPVADHHGADPVALDVRPDRLVLEQDQQPSAGRIGGQHGRQHGQGHPRLVAELRDTAVAGVEGSGRPRLGGHRVMATVIIPDPLPERPIRCIDAELLDPGVFVGRHGLRRELAADPVGRLGHHDGASDPQRRQRRGAAPQAAPDDHEIGGDLAPLPADRPAVTRPRPTAAASSPASPEPILREIVDGAS